MGKREREKTERKKKVGNGAGEEGKQGRSRRREL